MRRWPRRLGPLGLVALSTASCARCAKTSEVDDAGPPPVELPGPLPLPKPWKLYRAPATPFSLPAGCLERAPPVRGLAPRTTRFVADPRALATLVVGESQGNPPELVAAGALALGADGSTGPGTPLPWTEASSLPKLARGANGIWVAAVEVAAPTKEGPSRIALWRGGKSELLGAGDDFDVIDLGCVAERCALVTTRMATVAQPGASVWIGAPTDAASAWKRTDVVLPTTATGARPLALARLDASEVDVALLVGSEVAFWSAKGEPHEIARVPADHGVIEASSDPLPMALTYGVAVDDDGCPKDPLGPDKPSIRIERPGQPAVELKVVAPPQGGTIRRVGAGALVTWLTPSGCKSPHRAAYAIVLDAKGKPLAESPTALGEATGYAIASSGADVDMWFQDDAFVTWVRARCDVPAK